MKRYLDIENNIITFIEDYNRNYSPWNHQQPEQQQQQPSRTINSHRRSRCCPPNKSISENFARFIRHRPPPAALYLASHRPSIIGSSNSINSNLTTENNATINTNSNLRKLKSESDLLSILNSKNYRYYTDEIAIGSDHDDNDENGSTPTGYI